MGSEKGRCWYLCSVPPSASCPVSLREGNVLIVETVNVSLTWRYNGAVGYVLIQWVSLHFSKVKNLQLIYGPAHSSIMWEVKGRWFSYLRGVCRSGGSSLIRLWFMSWFLNLYQSLSPVISSFGNHCVLSIPLTVTIVTLSRLLPVFLLALLVAAVPIGTPFLPSFL